ncbi:MAG TPA: IS1380 family transposase [Micrococcales bacterium]|uniref:IS1380 family transposase n=1 Tax=Miniimonas arenae TaxID=676201 RepID=A0A5C5BAA8_9MICO|nr:MULTISPECIES: IS1380 family transposase [Miniimonas]TNU72771.1 IS1380 family transposase [Miniimonas arenae]HCX85016.1 IS1380 family transposase [Micrococcales bacterium]
MVNATRPYPSVRVDAAPVAAVGSAGGVLLTEVLAVSGLSSALSAGLERWRRPSAVHDPAKVLTDLALTLALGGDCLADAALLRGEPEVFGPVASEATVSRTITALAAEPGRVLPAIAKARKAARARVWELAGQASPLHGISDANPLVIDLDATIVISHSEKEAAAPTFKRTFGHHPLLAFADHGQAGSGELLAALLRPGNAGSNTAADHIEITRQALAAVPGINASRPGRKVMIRTDGAGASREFLTFLTRRGLSYSIGWTLPWAEMGEIYQAVTRAGGWTPALTAAGEVNEHADVADITNLLTQHGHLTGWPAGMRVIVRRERPHPGARVAQDRLDDAEGYRLTAFTTNTRRGQLQVLELRHRRRARCEDRIRCAKDTGLRNLPLKTLAQNEIWLAAVALATDLLAWLGLLGLDEDSARVWEPKRLRLRLFTAPATIARHARRVILHVKETYAWAEIVLAAHRRLRALAAAPT